MIQPASFQLRAEDVLATGAVQAGLHEAAAGCARERFGWEVFVRGVVEVSNFCREDCQYCGMRRSNRALARYRARWEDLAEVIIHRRPGWMTDINLQGGEDPVAVREMVLPLIRALRRETILGISVCLGTLDSEVYEELRQAGAAIYIMKFETAYPDRYAQFRAPGAFGERLEHIRWLAANGWRVSSGFIAGLPGHGVDEALACCRLAGELPLDGCSVSPFIPGEATPWAHAPAAHPDLALNCMALLRRMRPDWVIPAVSALNIADPEIGYRRGLRAGANLVTINLTPPALRDDYLLYKRDRVIMDEESILAALDAEGLRPSPRGLVEFYRSQESARLVPA